MALFSGFRLKNCSSVPHYIAPELLPTTFSELQCPQSQNTTGPVIIPSRTGNTHALLDHDLTGGQEKLHHRWGHMDNRTVTHKLTHAGCNDVGLLSSQ